MKAYTRDELEASTLNRIKYNLDLLAQAVEAHDLNEAERYRGNIHQMTQDLIEAAAQNNLMLLYDNKDW